MRLSPPCARGLEARLRREGRHPQPASSCRRGRGVLGLLVTAAATSHGSPEWEDENRVLETFGLAPNRDVTMNTDEVVGHRASAEARGGLVGATREQVVAALERLARAKRDRSHRVRSVRAWRLLGNTWPPRRCHEITDADSKAVVLVTAVPSSSPGEDLPQDGPGAPGRAMTRPPGSVPSSMRSALVSPMSRDGGVMTVDLNAGDSALEVESRQHLRVAISAWWFSQRRLGPIASPMLTEVWIAGFRSAGLDAKHGTAWSGGAKGYPKPLAFVIEFACPFGHRSRDERDTARVRVIVLDGGWIKRDPDSPCPECTAEVLERWLLACPRCAVGDDSGEHFENDGGEEYHIDFSPLSHVTGEFIRLHQIAEARWWVEHTEEAVAEAEANEAEFQARYPDVPRLPSLFRQQIEWRLAGARQALEQVVLDRPSRAVQANDDWSPPVLRKWLADRGVDPSQGVQAIWAQVRGMKGSRPPRAAVEAMKKAERASE